LFDMKGSGASSRPGVRVCRGVDVMYARVFFESAIQAIHCV
jgi:hypothetical protein